MVSLSIVGGMRGSDGCSLSLSSRSFMELALEIKSYSYAVREAYNGANNHDYEHQHMNQAEEAEVLSAPAVSAVVSLAEAVPYGPDQSEEERNNADNEGEDVDQQSRDCVNDHADVQRGALKLFHDHK